jgi:hypothetical protein
MSHDAPALDDSEQAASEETSEDTAPKLYTASPRYWVLALGGIGASILLLVDMFNGFHWDALLFVLAGLATGFWALWMATTRVLVTDDGVLVRRFSATYFVDYQQMLSIGTQGRFVSTVSLAYHPRLDNGIVDTEHVGALIIPGLVDQGMLVAQVEPRITR